MSETNVNVQSSDDDDQPAATSAMISAESLGVTIGELKTQVANLESLLRETSEKMLTSETIEALLTTQLTTQIESLKGEIQLLRNQITELEVEELEEEEGDPEDIPVEIPTPVESPKPAKKKTGKLSRALFG